MYRLDRTAFKMQKAEDAGQWVDYWLQQPPAERLRAATYLIASAWNFPVDDPPRLDRSHFRIKLRQMANNIFNPDFQDFIKALNQEQVEYLLVGGYAVILHGYNRTTGDMDIWVKKTSENYQRLVAAFRRFGMPVFDMTEQKFLNQPEYNVFTFGVSPVSIDVMNEVKGLDFEEAFQKATWFDIGDLSVRTINLESLLAAKTASGRTKDLNDIEQLKGSK